MSLRQYFELVTQIQGDLPPYLGNQALPELTALCDWSACFSGWAAPKMWIGPGGTVTPLHCDYDDNLFAQVRGSKRFTLYAPHHAEQLHTRKVNTVLYASKFDPERPDTSRFPEAAQLKALKCTVRAGEMLYLPAGWFHHVRAMDFSLSVNRWARDKPFALVQP